MSTIHFNPVTSILENRACGTMCVGIPGSGKTYFLLNIAANCLLTSCNVIYIDPKNDAIALKNIDPSISIIDINDIEPGALNPFRFLEKVDSNIIMSILKSICGGMSNEQIVAVSPIVQDFVIANKKNINETDFISLANYLYASENKEAQTIGTLLKMNEDSKYGKLLFSKSKGDFKINKSQVISLLGMQLPRSLKDLSQEEMFSSALIYIICKRLFEILSKDSIVPTVVIIDEVAMVYSNPMIEEIINTLLAMGRSLNVAVVLASQAVTHFPKNIAQFISNKFMFGMSNKEARYFLEEFDNSDMEFGLDRESIINFITNYEPGDCFMIDRKGRGGFLKIKSNLGDITSNPLFKKREEQQSEVKKFKINLKR